MPPTPLREDLLAQFVEERVGSLRGCDGHGPTFCLAGSSDEGSWRLRKSAASKVPAKARVEASSTRFLRKHPGRLSAAPAGTAPRSGRPEMTSRSRRLLRIARSGSAGQDPMTIPSLAMPSELIRFRVSSVWFKRAE